jgi:sodium/potassium-transporting ATPase subunit alpha
LKKNVIFSRVTPDQKLYIVDAAQKLKHIVAVIGDGVNDAPAMKKSDIGIAMGITGTEITKDNADILIMDDNFNNIARGIKRGRVCFDILKRMIGYNLTSNISENLPIIISYVLKFPFPISAIQILVIDMISDVYTNITYAYERAEAELMKRPPRDVEKDSLISFKLFSYGYLFMGVIEASAGFLAFFCVLHDYGFAPKGMLGIIHEYGIEPFTSDTYDQYDPYKGNSRAFIFENSEYLGTNIHNPDDLEEKKLRYIELFSDKDTMHDLRVFLYKLDLSTWTSCKVHGKNMDHDTPVCYSMEAIRHAQTAYFAAIMTIQVINCFCWRTITESAFLHIIDNMNTNLSCIICPAITAMLVYVPTLNKAFGCRPLIVEHWCIGFPIWITLFIYSEFTKYLIRTVKKPDESKGFYSKHFEY